MGWGWGGRREGAWGVMVGGWGRRGLWGAGWWVGVEGPLGGLLVGGRAGACEELDVSATTSPASAGKSLPVACEEPDVISHNVADCCRERLARRQ